MTRGASDRATCRCMGACPARGSPRATHGACGTASLPRLFRKHLRALPLREHGRARSTLPLAGRYHQGAAPRAADATIRGCRRLPIDPAVSPASARARHGNELRLRDDAAASSLRRARVCDRGRRDAGGVSPRAGDDEPRSRGVPSLRAVACRARRRRVAAPRAGWRWSERGVGTRDADACRDPDSPATGERESGVRTASDARRSAAATDAASSTTHPSHAASVASADAVTGHESQPATDDERTSPLDDRRSARWAMPLLQRRAPRRPATDLLSALRTEPDGAALPGLQHGARGRLEVLHDLRPRRLGRLMRGPLGSTTRRPLLAALAVASLAVAGDGCKGGERADRTADTAFAPIADSTARGTDSAMTAVPDSVKRDTTAQASRDTTPLLLVAVDSAI